MSKKKKKIDDPLMQLVEASPPEPNGKEVLDPLNPMESARKFVAKKYKNGDGIQLLHRYRGEFLSYDGSCFRQADDETLRAGVWTYADEAVCETKDGFVPFKPNRDKVSNILDGLQALTQLDKNIEPSMWLDGRKSPNPLECLSCANGILHVPTAKLHPSSPLFFCTSATDVIFDPKATAPQWKKFLKSAFTVEEELDQGACNTLQEIFGYILTPNTAQQKLFMMIGDKRSGKGTSARALAALLGGKSSVPSPTMGDLSSQFGVAPLIGKPLAIVSDARIGAKTDKSKIVERLLSISGEDGVTADRKHREVWTGRLQTRFLILTNEVPSLSDGSGALASRFIIITMKNSFYGREDHALEGKLKKELSGILNWSIDGYRRLMKRGHFVQPRSSEETFEQIEDLGSPAKAFVKECCVVKSSMVTKVDELFQRWERWCDKEKRRDPGTKEWFFRNLKAAVPGLRKERLREGDKRPWAYVGIGLLPEPF